MAPNILVVEDDELIAQGIRRVLLDLGYDVPAAVASGSDAFESVETRRPDLVLMEIRLKGPSDGIETAMMLREKHQVPIVYLSSHWDEATLARAKATGPHGYIVKPFTDRKLRTSIEVALGRHALESKAAAKAVRLSETNMELMARGEERKRESERLLAVARTDPLTDASNRLHLQEDLEAISDRAKRYGHQYCAAFCDIDSFKSYNDSFGHLAGDDAIRAVSDEIKRELRRGDSHYRYGGDEFLVLLPEQSLLSAWDCMERVRIAVEALPVTEDPPALARPVTISVGVADYRIAPDQNAIQSWLQRADTALYRAKARGRNCVEMSAFTPSTLPSRPPPSSNSGREVAEEHATRASTPAAELRSLPAAFHAPGATRSQSASPPRRGR